MLYDDSTQYVEVPVTSAAGESPTAIDLAFTALGLPLPDLPTWHPAELTTGGAQLLVGPGGVDLTPGRYSVHVRVAADPETVILRSGTLTIR
ncbi:hypothetical protein B4N89_20610 [Embleya scabrispora]|uniref:Uncharacterized protein n=1 Tax=Embleya scabrispora TaxID=159449 RepID=A0A1T3P1P3_9ACTN|nr:hypothetical protein B4N89_20610 [Embleya scabrispora]